VGRQLIRAGEIITMDAGRRRIRNGALLVSGSRIERLLTEENVRLASYPDATVVDAHRLVAIPGFVQTHVHLCQTLFRGLAEDRELLDWLQARIFPLEAAHNAASMYASARVGLAELLRSGTTTVMDMGSIHHEEEVVRAVGECGIRAFVGKAMMDVNSLYPALREETRTALDTTLRQAEQWHGSAEGRILYAVAPRYVLSCSDDLLKEAYAITRSFPGMLFHTHASENRKEMDAVRARCGMDNVEFFEHLDILHANTCLAHCIWLNNREIDAFAGRQAKVLHCPSSNLKLGSGIALVPELRRRGITVSLGADGAPCNNTLDMFQEMRLAALMQKVQRGPLSMPAADVLDMATMGGAKALGLDHAVGSLEAGKRADLALLNLDRLWNPLAVIDENTIYGAIVHSGRPENVDAVMVDGTWVYRGGIHLTVDVSSAMHDARRELGTLLQRAHLS
jgi:5-methylthioadenosine/S-adenosylhomocysteine deaminase